LTVKFLPCGDSAIVVEFGTQIDRGVSEQVLRLSARIRAARLAGVIETVPTFRSLMVHYDPLQTGAVELADAICALLGHAAALEQRQRLWRVPVCYEGEYAPDLASVAERTGLTATEVIDLHSRTQYHVYMIGFLPGFPYMGDLPERLALPRRIDPRVRVPAGSVAIATAMTAVYPIESPGGWHLIGTTPIGLFDAGSTPPALIAPGDAVKFDPIGEDTFTNIRAAVEGGTYVVPHERMVA
jgi:inhibitor of KinA